MIVDKDFGWVAMWLFDEPTPVTPTSRDQLRPLLRMCQIAAETLERHELFHPTAIVFAGWLRSEPAHGTFVRVDEPEEYNKLPENTPAASLLDHCEAILERLEKQRGFLYPAFVKFLGNGVILDAQGNRHVQPNVFWIQGTTLNHHVVYLRTQSDAWLPYTLKAEPQLEVSKRNAPRLEAALRELQQRLGIELTPDESTRYAAIDGLTLANHRDVDGDVLAVI